MKATVSEASESAVSIDGTLHWDTRVHKDNGAMDANIFYAYVIMVISESEKSNQSIIMIETSNTSTQLTLFFDQDYNISVVARNCIGTTGEPAELYITWDG